MDSPHTEANEIIADIEDEGYGQVHWNSMYFRMNHLHT